MGGQEYYGQFNPDTGMFTVSGTARDQYYLIPRTASYGGDPMTGYLNIWGAAYALDQTGTLYLNGIPSGRVALRR
jgi:hypothetical protein